MKIIKVKEIADALEQVFPGGVYEVTGKDLIHQDIKHVSDSSEKTDQRIACEAIDKALSSGSGSKEAILRCTYGRLWIVINIDPTRPQHRCINCSAPANITITIGKRNSIYKGEIYTAECKYSIRDIREKLALGEIDLREHLLKRIEDDLDMLGNLKISANYIEEHTKRFREILDE